VKGRVLDVAALVDVATGKTRYTRSLVTTAISQVMPLAVPATALAAAWSQVDARGRLTLATLCEQSVVLTFPLDVAAAGVVGELLDGSVQLGQVDVVAGQVAAIAADRGWPVVTDRGPQLRAMAAGVEIESLP
jgi:hypothetical protein